MPATRRRRPRSRGGGGSGCVLGTPVVSGGTITSIPVTTAGSGYTTPPTITITDSTGSGCIAMPLAAFAPPGQNFSGLGGGTSAWYVGEAVTSTPHYLKSGQLLSSISGASTYTISNGAGSTLAGQSLGGAGNSIVAWVTSPTTFVFFAYMYPLPGTINSAGGLPGGMQNVVGSNAVTFTVSMQIPLPGIIPWEAAAQIVGADPGVQHSRQRAVRDIGRVRGRDRPEDPRQLPQGAEGLRRIFERELELPGVSTCYTARRASFRRSAPLGPVATVTITQSGPASITRRSSPSSIRPTSTATRIAAARSSGATGRSFRSPGSRCRLSRPSIRITRPTRRHHSRSTGSCRHRTWTCQATGGSVRWRPAWRRGHATS